MKTLVPVVFLIALALDGCASVEIARSSKRTEPPIGLELPGQVAIYSVGAVNMNFPPIVNHVDFFPAGFRIDGPGLVAYVDPIGVEDPKPADFIFLTRAHGDHFSPADIAKIATGKTVIYAPKTVIDSLKGYKAKLVRPGDSMDLGTMSFEAYPAYNLRKIFHPKKDENVGYVFTVGGSRIYIAGDTDFAPELRAVRNIDVAMLPFDGGTTMGPKEAASMVNWIKPRTVVPIHFALGTKNLGAYLALLDSGIEAKVLQGK